MIWLSPNEGHLSQTNAMIRLLRINPVSVRDTCMLCHEEFPKMHKSHEELSKIHKIP